MTIHLPIAAIDLHATRPGCCVCDPVVCAADDTGEHCAARSCGVCLHGCPASTEQTCCLDGDAA